MAVFRHFRGPFAEQFLEKGQGVPYPVDCGISIRTDMTKPIKNLGRWAEDQFAAFCSEAGVTANRSQVDETGWDFLFELPAPRAKFAPPDLQRIETTARAQVKSRLKGALSTELKLSNARRFAALPEPCFVILAAATNGGHPVRFYAKHFWQDEIERTLKRLREADHKSKPIHKQSLTITFDEQDDHTDDLIVWITSTIAAVGSDYAGQKRRLNESLGYEKERFTGSITFLAADLEKLIDHSIGLDVDIDVLNARMVDRRFGIEAKTPIFDAKPQLVHLRSHPDKCAIEITDQRDRVHRFEGQLFRGGLPGLPADLTKVRVVAGPFECILRGTGEATFNYHFNSADRHELHDLQRCVAFLGMADNGPLQFTVEFGGSRMHSNGVRMEPSTDAPFFNDSAVLLAALVKVADKADNAAVSMSLDDLIQAWEAVYEFRNHIDADSVNSSLEGPDGDALSTPIKRLAQGITVAVGELRFSAVLGYRLEGDEIEGQKRRLTFSKPALVHAIANDCDETSHAKVINEEIHRYAQRHCEGVITIQRSGDDSQLAISLVNPG